MVRSGRNTSGLSKKSCKQDYAQNRQDKKVRSLERQLFETIVYKLDPKYSREAIEKLQKYYGYSELDISELVQKWSLVH